MPPSQIRDTLIAQLRLAFLRMTSPDYLLDLDDAPQSQQQDSANRLLQVQHARLKLANENLADIRQQLIDNEADLTKGTAALAIALEDLSNVKAVLTAVGSLIDIIAKVLPLVLAA